MASPGGAPADTGTAGYSAVIWHEFEGPGPDLPELWLWADDYIPFERLSPAQRAARSELGHRLTTLSAGPGEILDASYAGRKPARMDVENVLLYSVGTGCFRLGGRHGIRFELATGPRRDPPSHQRFGSSYRYRLIGTDSPLTYWR